MTYTKVSAEFRQEFDQLVNQANNILITSHTHPDDDSIGSVLSTYYVLKSKYSLKNIQILYSGEIDDAWNYFENFSQIKRVADIGNHLSDFDLIIYLDSSQYSRFSDLPEKLAECKKPTICIDHHKNPADNFTLLLQDTNAASASELVYLSLVQDLPKIESRLGETLLLGILGDTGQLTFVAPSQSYVFDIVKKLVQEADINIQELKSKYKTYPMSIFKIVQELIKNTQLIQIDNWPEFLYSYLSRNYVIENKLTDIQLSSAKGIFKAGFSTSIKEADWSAVFSPDENGDVSLSVRSRPGSVNCRMMMQAMGIGGGHDRAAGGIFETKDEQSLEVEETFEKFRDWMKQNKPTLT